MSKSTLTTKLFTVNSWVIALLPPDISATLPSRGTVLIKGTMNDTDFLAVLEPDGRGSHWLNVDEPMRDAANVAAGDEVTLSIEPSSDWPEPMVPADVLAALKADPEAKEFWDDVTPMARWDWLRWINSTNNPDTHKHHIEVALSKLKAGERRPCCFNRSMCCVPEVSKSGMLIIPAA